MVTLTLRCHCGRWRTFRGETPAKLMLAVDAARWSVEMMLPDQDYPGQISGQCAACRDEWRIALISEL